MKVSCHLLSAWGPDDTRDQSVDLQGARNFLSRLCADKVYAPFITTRRDDVAGGPVLPTENFCVKAHRAPAARSVVVPQDQIHHISLAVEQGVETRAEDDARAVAVPGCTARGAVARARRQVAGLRRAGGGSVLRRALGVGVLPPPCLRGAPTAAALRGPPPKARGAGVLGKAPSTREARQCFHGHTAAPRSPAQ